MRLPPRRGRWFARVTSYMHIVTSIVFTTATWQTHGEKISPNLAAFLSGLAVVDGLGSVIRMHTDEAGQPDRVSRLIFKVMEGHLQDFDQEQIRLWGWAQLGIFLRGEDGLMTCFSSVKMGHAPDVDLQWADGQGPIPYCWVVNRATVVDLAPHWGTSYEDYLSRSKPSEVSGLNREQWRTYREVGSVLCVPVPHPLGGGYPIGVLALHAREPLDTTALMNEERGRKWSRRAEHMARILGDAGMVAKRDGE